MTPAARLAAAADILDALSFERPIEAQLKDWARGNRYAGSKDRAAIADRVYTCLRRWRSTAARMAEGTGRARVLASLAEADGLPFEEIDALCSGGYGLAPLTSSERHLLEAKPDYASAAERFDWPEWLYPSAQSAFEKNCDAELDALRQRATVDLRVNTLKASPSEARERLHSEGFHVEPVEGFACALRTEAGRGLIRSTAFTEGLVELQDAGSQAAAMLSNARPGERVLDYCAGGGGKTLALAAMMQNQGTLTAHDADPRRLKGLDSRAQRAGASIIASCAGGGLAELAALKSSCDLVFLDVPCSGSGSWRRDPAGKWRLTQAALDDRVRAQTEILKIAPCYLNRDGRILYATCSVLREENEQIVEAFLSAHPDFQQEASLRLSPAQDGCDGFFAARLKRKP